MGASQCFAIGHCVRDLRSITPPPQGSAAEHLGPCLRRSAMTFAMSAASVSVRWCCAPSAMTSAARATRFPRRTRCSRRSCHSTEAAMRTRPAQKAGTPRPEKLERAEPDLIANPDRVQAHFVMAAATGRRAPRELRFDRQSAVTSMGPAQFRQLLFIGQTLGRPVARAAVTLSTSSLANAVVA